MGERVRNVVFDSGEDRSSFLNDLAAARDMPPVLLVAQAIAESGLREDAERWAYVDENNVMVNLTPQAQAAIKAEDWGELQRLLDVVNSYGSQDISFGPGQQTVAFASIGDQTQSLDNVLAVRDKYLDDPEFALTQMADQLQSYWHDFTDGPEAMGRYNWPARGLDGNPNARHILASWAEAQQYLDHSDVVYDPDVPAERQRQDWTCSIRSAAFLLHSIGDWIDAGDLQDLMVDRGLVNSADGLLDGSGTGLAAFLAERTGLPVRHGLVDWAFLQTYAGTYPMIMGSGTLYHWVAVRKVNPDGSIALSNPAPNWKGVGDELTYGEYAQYAPWYGVWIPLPQAPVQEEDELSAEEREELGRLRSLVSSYENDTFTPIAKTMDAIISGTMKKDEIVSKVGEMRNSIRENVGV